MGWRLTGLAVAGVAALTLAGSASGVEAPPPEPLVQAAAAPSWAAPQIAAVVAAGVMAPDGVSFRPEDPLTRGELHEAILALGKPHGEPADPARFVTMRELDAQLVAAAGLLRSARTIRLAARGAGLEPIDMLGTETVARLLGLRLNHPAGSEHLERAPKMAASRAEAAYSLSKLLTLEAWKVSSIRELAAGFVVPTLSDWQRSVLTKALRFVGYPYVFSGTSEKTQKLWSAAAPGGTITVPGGFDCSGLVWRVFKLEPYVAAPLLSGVLKGRTTYAMSGRFHGRCASTRRRSRPATSSSSGARARSRSRRRSDTPGSTSATAGSSTRRAGASRCSRCRGGIRHSSPGRVGRWLKPGCNPGSAVVHAGRLRP